MQLQTETQEKLDRWMGASDTWYTRHDTDMDRWYDFVYMYKKNEGFNIPEVELREYIANGVGIKESEGPLIDEIDHRISLAYHILDFMKRVGL